MKKKLTSLRFENVHSKISTHYAPRVSTQPNSTTAEPSRSCLQSLFYYSLQYVISVSLNSEGATHTIVQYPGTLSIYAIGSTEVRPKFVTF